MAKPGKQRGDSRSPLTAEAVGHILGDVDAAVITEVLTTGATPEELVEAYEWLTSDDYMGARLHRPMTGIVARLCSILESQMPAAEER